MGSSPLGQGGVADRTVTQSRGVLLEAHRLPAVAGLGAGEFRVGTAMAGSTEDATVPAALTIQFPGLFSVGCIVTLGRRTARLVEPGTPAVADRTRHLLHAPMTVGAEQARQMHGSAQALRLIARMAVIAADGWLFFSMLAVDRL